jgi:hypothetical protein
MGRRVFVVRTRLLLALFLALLAVLPYGRPSVAVRAQSLDGGRYYPETGYTLAAEFVSFYDSYGGLALFGYPVSEARTENGYLVQWTERQRLEYHPENAGTRFEVLLGLLGRELTDGLDGPQFVAAQQIGTASLDDEQSAQAGGHYFEETGQYVSDEFFAYWQARGGVPVFGYPISTLHDESGYMVQWFERARFELHPENSIETRVLLGHLGYEALKVRALLTYKIEVHDTPAPEAGLQIGLSQGGESSDPGFFDNIRQTGAALGPGLVRIDNIFNHYNIVSRGPDGLLTYHWDDLDRALNGIRAMGKEPLICLSYMPEALTSKPGSRVSPPANYDEWGALVKATVTHVNIDRRMGVRYWEVWNEPDQWSFWQAPYPEYMHLYDVAADAAIAADPTVKLGGPGVASFLPSHLDEFLQHQFYRGDKARVDFITWHSYGYSVENIGASIRKAREIIAKYPGLDPEIIISEFNVLQGGAGDTSANGYTDTAQGAIAFLSSIEGMQRDRLDRALLFELKDGPGPKSYWGRWGILTYDGKPKPIYHALAAYQNRPSGMLPVTLREGDTNGSVGMMAFGGPSRSTMMLWYTGDDPARIKLNLPSTFNATNFDVALFDKEHNNPAKSGDPTLKYEEPRNARDLLLDLKPDSLVLLFSR